ncbi:MAG: hypothetical protein E3J72_18195 [Planctomycetota bacterium]|nr:MAG: hypothetical protein E3J72_18195 [Planctomycetota bacterium]
MKPTLIIRPLAVILCAAVISGCGLSATISQLTGGKDDDNTGAIAAAMASINTAPSASIDAPQRLGNVPVDVHYRLIDLEKNDCSIKMQFSPNDGTDWYFATQATGGDGMTGLSASVSGVDHVFVWNAPVDFGFHAARNVILRVIPSDGKLEGDPAESASFDAGNDPPEVFIPTPQAGQGGFLPVDYLLKDTTADLCTLLVEYSADNGSSFLPAAIRLSSKTTLMDGLVPNIVSGLPPAGVEGFVTWDTGKNLPAGFRGNIIISVTPRDVFDNGVASVTSPFLVSNNTPPQCMFETDLEGQLMSGLQFFMVRISDSNSDPASLLVFYTDDGGTTMHGATLLGSYAGLNTSPTGESHLVIWSTDSDFEDIEAPNVNLILIAFDTEVGPENTSSAFAVDNLAPGVESFILKDRNGDGSIETIDVAMSEAVLDNSLISPLAFMTSTGLRPSSVSTKSVPDDRYFRLEFTVQIPGTSIVDVFYFSAGQLTDLAGNYLPNIGAGDVSEIDAASPVIVEALALESPPGGNGPDNGDIVQITFTEKTNKFGITGADIDAVLPLSDDHVWTDNTGQITAAEWDDAGIILTVTFSDNSGQATLASGDIISPDNASITDATGNPVISLAQITGSLNQEWIKYTGYSPPRLAGSAGIYEPINNRLVMFGGVADPTLYATNDVWTLKLGRGREKWRKLNPGGTIPAERYNHAAIYDAANHQMIIFGGNNGTDWSSNEIYALDLTLGCESWSQIEPTIGGGGDMPGAHGHLMIYDENGKRAIIYGGDTDFGPFDNIWEIRLTAGSETAGQVKAIGAGPDNCWDLHGIYDSAHKQFVITGIDLGETFSLDLSVPVDADLTWSVIANHTAYVAGAAAVYDAANDRMVALGSNEMGAFGTWNFTAFATSLSPGKESWFDLNPAGGNPSPRAIPVTVYDPIAQRAIIFGGDAIWFGGGGYMGDTWELNLLPDSETFKELAFPGHPPAERAVVEMTHDPVNNRMLLYGGTDGFSIFDDLWSFNLTPGQESWRKLKPIGGNLPGGVANYVLVTDAERKRVILWGGMNDWGQYRTTVYSFDITDPDYGYWDTLRNNGPVAVEPSGREFATGVIDTANNRFVIYGGVDPVGGIPLFDVWAFNLNPGCETWTEILTPLPPLIPNEGEAIYDPANQSMVFVGAGGMYRLDLSTPGSESWTLVPTAGAGPPAGLGNFSMVYNPAAHTAFIFGGIEATWTDNSWKLTLTVGSETWSEISFPNTPNARSHHAAGYDAANSRVVIFGGINGPFVKKDTWWVYY